MTLLLWLSACVFFDGTPPPPPADLLPSVWEAPLVDAQLPGFLDHPDTRTFERRPAPARAETGSCPKPGLLQ